MAVYELSQRTFETAALANVALVEIRTSLINKCRLFELGIDSVLNATSVVIGLGRPSAIGVGPVGAQSFLDNSDGNGPPSQTTMAVAWTTGPAIPTNFNRRATFAASNGVGVLWVFNRGLAIPPNNSIAVWNLLAATLTSDVWAVIDE